MKWKCTTPKLLSIPVAAAVIGFGMTAIAQDRGGQTIESKSSVDTSMTAPLIAKPSTGQAAKTLIEAGSLPGVPSPQPFNARPQMEQTGGILFDNGPADGTNGLSHFQGTLDGTSFDRVIADDFVVGDAIIDGARVCGVWFAAASCPGPFGGNFRIRIWNDAAGQPQAAPPIHDTTSSGSTCTATGQVFFGRPEVCYEVKLSSNAVLSAGTYWMSVQPTGTTDNFFHLTSSANPPANGAQVHLQGDFSPPIPPPNWQPGSAVFGDEYDVTLRIFGVGEEVTGACCPPKEDGEDQACIDDIFGGECADLGGTFHANLDCDAVTCPSQVECPEDVCPPCLGDINDSGVVDGGDLLLLLGCWGPVEPGCECADLNNSGVVDGGDLLLLLGNWGPCPQASGEGGEVFDENEPCGERINDGCNMDVPAFTDINCGDTVCGTAWTGVEFEDTECPGDEGHLPGSCGPDGQHCGAQSPDGCWCDADCWGFSDCCLDICDECFGAQEVNVRDTDWYRIVVKEPKQNVTWRVHAEFPAQAIIAWADPDCDEIVIIASAESPAKVPFEISACLQPDVEYILFISPTVFEGLPCEGEAQWGHAYTAEVICQDGVDCQKGACCFAEDCVEDYDEVLCAIDGGLYLGDGTDCAGDPCAFPVGACCLNDGVCVEADIDDCINNLEGAYRGNGTSCADMVLIDFGCNGQEQLVPICRDCQGGGEVWCNLQDVCDEDIDQDPFNGGCNYFDPDTGEFEAAFEQVCCGDLVGGSVWSIEGQGRDLDWRHLTIKEDSIVTISIDHGFGQAGLDAILFFARAGCPAQIIESGTVSSGGALVRQLEAGNYYVIVAPQFSTGNDIECGTSASQYQLQISCGTVDETVCAGNCGGIFIEHDGFPTGFCSCDADSCVPYGATHGQETDHCCPGVCDHCDGDFCVVLCSYRYDNSEFAGGIGLDDPTQTIMWLHRDVTPAGGDTIHSIRTNYSHTHSGGLPVGWAIFEAATDGTVGNLIASNNTFTTEPGAVGNGGMFTRQIFDTGGVAVPDGQFYYAVFSTGSSHPAPWENTGGLDSEVWVAACNAGWDDCNPAVNHPDNWSFPPSILSPFNIEAIWLMCALGDT